MRLFQKGKGVIHEKKDHALSGDLFFALNLMRNNGKGEDMSLALGEHDNSIFSEVKTEDVISMAILDTKKKTFKGIRLSPKTKHTLADRFSDENLEDCVAAIALALRVINPPIDEFIAFENANNGLLSISQEYELSNILMEIEGKIALEMHSNENKMGLNALANKVLDINMSMVETGMLCPSKVIFGNFEGFKMNQRKSTAVSLSAIKDKYILNKERTFSQEEQNLMFNIPSYYSVSSNVLSIAEKVKASWDKSPNLRKVNILMEGPAGTGKTMDSKVLSRLLGLPYTKITCFSDMDSSDVTGAILPVANEELDLPIPSDDEIFFDPAGSYERLTGKKADENITEADVREAINEIYESFYSSQEGKNSPRYVYYASEIVKAFENGWLCEVQERARRL